MLKCSQCNSTLPDFATMCQFCGNTWSPSNSGPAGTKANITQAMNSLAWVRPAYYGIAAYWVVSGIIECLTAKGSTVGIVLGAINILVGLGLILKVEVIRSVVNAICFVNILFGVLALVGAFFSPFVGGLIGVVIVIMNFVNLGTSGLMIFLIGETESRGPNF